MNPPTVELLAIVDSAGRIVAAEIEDESTPPGGSDDAPSAGLLPLDGQREVSVAVPREVLQLPGPELHQFLSRVRVRWPAELQIPEITITRHERK